LSFQAKGVRTGDPIFEPYPRSACSGINVTLVETGRLLADQIGSTALELKGRFPIALSEIEHTRRVILVGTYRLVTFVVELGKLEGQRNGTVCWSF
jgi:hypothetical protein